MGGRKNHHTPSFSAGSSQAFTVITVTSKKARTFGFCKEQLAVFHSANDSIHVCLEKQKQKHLPENRFFHHLLCAKTMLEQHT